MWFSCETCLTEKPLSGTFWSLCLREGKLCRGSQQQYSSLEVTVPSCVSFIWTGKKALSYPHKRDGKRGPSGAESWRESTHTTHCRCYPESLCILETKKVSFRDFMFFRLLSFAHSCSLENHLKYYKMYMWKEIWEIGTQILRCQCSTTHSEHSILTFILSSLYLVLQRSTERQAGSCEPAHSLTVCRGDNPAGHHYTVWQEDKVPETSESHPTQLGRPGRLPGGCHM